MEPASNGATKPTQIKVHVSTGAGVDIEWADGHRSHYDFSYLRNRCPCAVCNDERGRANRLPGQEAFPLFKAKVTARAASPVGHYAVQFDFSDGHTAGIFSYPYLREICPCEKCRAPE